MIQRVITYQFRGGEASTLNNGITLPALGYGVFETPPEETATALKTGYRHIDTAAGYDNERGVGDGLRRSGLAREDVFLETKVWVSDYGYDETLHALRKAPQSSASSKSTC